MERHIAEQGMLKAMKGVDKDFAIPLLRHREQIPLLRRMRDVQRLAGFRLSRPYSDAEHCYYTGLLFIFMANIHAISLSAEEVEWVLCHDFIEVMTGDLLNPIKRLNQKTEQAWNTIEEEIAISDHRFDGFEDEKGRSLLGDKWSLFTDCDSLELFIFCEEERQRGNILYNVDGSSVQDCMYRILINSSYGGIREFVKTAVSGL